MDRFFAVLWPEVEEWFAADRKPLREVFFACGHSPQLLVDEGEREGVLEADHFDVEAVVALGPRADHLVHRRGQQGGEEPKQTSLSGMGDEVVDRDFELEAAAPLRPTRGVGGFGVDVEVGRTDL